MRSGATSRRIASTWAASHRSQQRRTTRPSRWRDSSGHSPPRLRPTTSCADRVRLAGGDHKIVRLVLLKHLPHGADVVAGVAPVATRLEIAQAQLMSPAELDPGRAVGDLACDKLAAAPRGLVVEQDAGAAEHPVALTV